MIIKVNLFKTSTSKFIGILTADNGAKKQRLNTEIVYIYMNLHKTPMLKHNISCEPQSE